MSGLSFLLEIGTEEIPDWMIAGALQSLESHALRWLEMNSLSFSRLVTEATPRRLVIQIDDLPERQADAEEWVQGPPVSAGDRAAIGFAKKMSVPVDELRIETTPKGEYFSYLKMMPGRATLDILAETVPLWIHEIHFPKTMKWIANNPLRFIRPIRWLVALLGDQVVPLEIAGLPPASNITRGHRKLGSSSIPVTVENYRDSLKANGVILSANGRREKIETGMAELLDQTGLHVRRDPDLLETLVYITEHPTPILGGFDEQYLELPSEVLVTVMRHHQKYFSVEDARHELAPRFIAVMNTNADPDGLVRRGNERVLRARFNDARFFWEMDQHKKLADRVADLANVTFQAKLGSYLEKTKRNVAAARELAEMAGVDAASVERAALLLKADLTTEMVKEFTDLQGIIGGLYAKAQGEPEEVWRAVYDQYKPVGIEDIPATAAGRLVALADKLDTLRGCFSVGLMPTGSKDPFALRRAAQGVVRILVGGQLEFPLSKLAGDNKELREFLLDRVRYYFREVSGFAYDEVNAVLASGSDNLPDIEARLKALKAVRPTENFEPLAASFKRIQNILRQASFAETGNADHALLEEGPERTLYDEFQRVRDAARTTEYLPALQAIASLRPAVDLFFDKVLVNAPDPNVRRNRLALLNGILTEFSTIADFSEIVTTS